MSDADLQNGLAQAQFMPDATSLGTSVLDSVSANFEAGRRNAGEGQVINNMTSALQDHLDTVEQKTGQKFDNPLSDWSYNEKAPWVLHNTAQALDELADKRGDPSLAMPDFDGLYQGGIEKARAAQRTVVAQEGGPMAPGAGAAGFLANIAGQFSDPESLALNTAAYALVPAAGPLANATLHAAAGFAAGQLANEADSFQYKKAINPEFGFGDAAKEVAAAGAFGAGTQLAGAGFAALWRRFRSTSPTVAAAIPQPIQDAGNLAERHADLDAQNPFQAGIQGVQAHRDAITKLESDLVAGRTPELPPNVQEAARASTPTPIENVADRAAAHSDPGVQRIGESLTAVSDDWATMQDAAPPMHDITPAIGDAVDAIVKAKDEGKPVSEILTQGDTFYSDQAQQATRLFLKDDGKIASKAEIADNLSTYAKQAGTGNYGLTPAEQAHFDRYNTATFARTRAAYGRMDTAMHVGRINDELDSLGISREESAPYVGAASRILQNGKETSPSAAYERAVMQAFAQDNHLRETGATELLRGTPFEDMINEKIPAEPREASSIGSGGAGRQPGFGQRPIGYGEEPGATAAATGERPGRGGAGSNIGEHESGLIRDATKPEEVAKVSTDPAVHDAMMADLQRNIEQGNNRVPVEDEQGNSKLGFADKELAEIERQEAAAREIAGCATPAQAA
ncbi:MAG TPA: hypothetical protein VK495_06000 [Steroidobacteraceae bacterium]|nr:hypothetical protein [Steroidobacteraceae bacterium]